MTTAKWDRPKTIRPWTPNAGCSHWRTNTDCAWHSNGGSAKRHPDRALPFNLSVSIEDPGQAKKVHIVGCFALYVDAENEPEGTLGASILLESKNGLSKRIPLLSGQHYRSSDPIFTADLVPGDGTLLQSVGVVEIDGIVHRVDVLSIDLNFDEPLSTVKLIDHGSAASFVLIDVWIESESKAICPFSSKSAGPSLIELGTVVRIRDHASFSKLVEKLESSLRIVEKDLDEAKGLLLTFLAVVCAAKLESGAPRSLHRFQLDASRAVDRCQNVEQLLSVSRQQIAIVAGDMLENCEGTERLVKQALNMVAKQFANKVTDSDVAEHLGLSPSHFRHLFRRVTDQPFHQYVLNLRLERARSMLMNQRTSVSEVARQVGYANLAHFSRAFSKRFGVAPSVIKQSNAGR